MYNALTYIRIYNIPLSLTTLSSPPQGNPLLFFNFFQSDGLCTACSIARLFHNRRDHIGIYGNGSIRNLSRCRACAIEIETQSIRTSSTLILTGVNRYRSEIGTYRTHYRFISRATRRRNDLR